MKQLIIMEKTAAAAAVCDIDRLPEEMLMEIISRTSPPAACCAAAVSRAFRAVAASDDVWFCFLPPEFPRFAKRELRCAPTSKKGLFVHLSDHPALLPKKYMRMHLDRVTGAKCFTLSAAALHISSVHRGDWKLIHLRTRCKRFSEAVDFSWYLHNFDIRGKIPCRMLSQNSTYTAYMVFKLESYEFYNSEISFEEAIVNVGGRRSTQKIVALATVARDKFGSIWKRDGHQGDSEHGDDTTSQVPKKHILVQHWSETESRVIYVGEDVVFPRKRADDWMEVELGEFHIEENDDDNGVSVGLRQTEGATVKRNLVVWCIEIRTKR